MIRSNLNENKAEVNVYVNGNGISESIEKVNRYIEVLQEAKTLAEELASLDIKIEIK